MHPAGPDGAKQNNTRETPPATGESRDGRTFCVMLVPEKLGYVGGGRGKDVCTTEVHLWLGFFAKVT